MIEDRERVSSLDYDYDHEHEYEYEHDQAAGRREVPRAAASGARSQPPRPAGAATPCHHGGGSAGHMTWCVVADPAAMG